MASYSLSPSLKLAFADYKDEWPKRSTASDGWIGDSSHKARKSDHNPNWEASGKRKGLVHAIDVTVKGANAKEIIREAMQHPSCWYIIHKGIIYSRTYNWAARKYNGNPHTAHIHISILYTEKAEFSKVHWLDVVKKPTTAKPAQRKVSVAKARKAFKAGKAGKTGTFPYAKHVQNMLKRLGHYNGKVDGIIGPESFRAFRAFERKEKFKFADGIPSTRGLIVLFKRGKEGRPTRVVG